MSFTDRVEKSGTVRLMSLVQILLEKRLLSEEEASSISSVQCLVDRMVEQKVVDIEEINVADIRCREFLREFYHAIMGEDVSRSELESFTSKYEKAYPSMVGLAKLFYDTRHNLN